MSSSGHFVDFYENDEQFAAYAATFLQEGFLGDGSCIAVLTRPHLRQVSVLLERSGLDTKQFENSYRYHPLIAEEMLATLWRNDRLNASAFHKNFGDLIRLCGSGGKDVRIVGEMAALLALRGRPDAAIEIEELGNDLSREHVFGMYCLYPHKAFTQPSSDIHKRRVCGVHSGSFCET